MLTGIVRDVTWLMYEMYAHWGYVESSDVGGGWEEIAGGVGPGESSGFPSPEGQFSSVSFEQDMKQQYPFAIPQNHIIYSCSSCCYDRYVICSTFTHSRAPYSNEEWLTANYVGNNLYLYIFWPNICKRIAECSEWQYNIRIACNFFPRRRTFCVCENECMLHEIPEAVTLQQMKSVWYGHASITCTLKCLIYYILTLKMSLRTQGANINMQILSRMVVDG